MYTGSLPAATTFSTWVENIEVLDADDTPIDFSVVDEITVQVYDLNTGSVLLELTRNNGDITTPADGIVQWRAEAEDMGGFDRLTYGLRLIIEQDDDTIALTLGTVPIVG